MALTNISRSTVALIVLAVSTAPPMAWEGRGDQEEARAAYRLVVHSSNPASEMTRTQVGKIFMRTVREWEDGRQVEPVDQSVTSPVRKAFTEDVLHQSILAIRNHWRKVIFSGEALPPPVRGSESEVLDFVAQNAGAIAYVSASARLPATVKAVAVTE